MVQHITMQCWWFGCLVAAALWGSDAVLVAGFAPFPPTSSSSSSHGGLLGGRSRLDDGFRGHTSRSLRLSESSSSSNDDDAKFGMAQRIDSVKSLIVGALAGSIAVAIPEFVHQVVLPDLLALPMPSNGLAQFEFDNDAAAVEAGLFAIVYRYCIRQDENPQLQQGVVGAFAIVRTLSRVAVPASCRALPLSCGAPLQYLDWSMLTQLGVNAVESAVLFAAAAVALEYCMNRKWISKFPG